MRVTTEELVDRKSMVGFMVLGALGRNDEALVGLKDKGYCDVVLTLDGKEADLKSFVRRWEQHVAGLVKEAASDLAVDRLRELDDLIAGVRKVCKQHGFYVDEDAW